MSDKFLHEHPQFADLLAIVGKDLEIAPVLIEKDYWIMHCLYGLQNQGFRFELKGGTSLSKGFGIINRFSEDIDIRIEPPEGMEVKVGRHHDKEGHVQSRRDFYDWLTRSIAIPGITTVARDHQFDDTKLRSAGIRLQYQSTTTGTSDLKEGILLEAGFDDITPNFPVTISSWAYDYAGTRIRIIDNRAVDVPCYHPGYTLVEKLQTISTKFRRQQEQGNFPPNFLRHYYDVYCLLNDRSAAELIGTDEYRNHKEKRFRSENKDLVTNPAFTLSNSEIFVAYEAEYERNRSLYYRSRPSFTAIIERIRNFAELL